jgi:hypothetical protein
MQKVSRKVVKPSNLPEVVVWYSIVCTYPAYFLGVQLTWVTVLATFLTGYLFRSWWNQTAETPIAQKIKISSAAWIWVIGVLVIEAALIVGHLDYNYGPLQIIRSSFRNWYRSWALFALFILIGHLDIRPKVIYRAVCILCLQCLVMIGIAILANLVHLPQITYTIPFDILCGSPERCTVELIPTIPNVASLNFDQDRLKLFAVWPTFLALLGNLYFFLALHEQERTWRWIGLISSVLMIVASFARAATLCLPFIILAVWFLTNVIKPWLQFTAGFSCFFAGLYSSTLLDWIKTFKQNFNSARAGSSRVRARIYQISLERWYNEAPIWGRGIGGEKGPTLIEHLPLGSHQTWIGILFAHGIVGCAGLASAFLYSFIELCVKAQSSEIARLGLSILLILFVGSLVDNIDFFAYLFWPGLIMLGIAFKENLPTPKRVEMT